MMGLFTDPEHKAITAITVIQSAVVVSGTIFVANMMNLTGFGISEKEDAWFSAEAVFIHRRGFLALLVPSVWASVALILTHREHTSALRIWRWLGVIMIVGGIRYYAVLAFFCA